jgi:hypothetical protein
MRAVELDPHPLMGSGKLARVSALNTHLALQEDNRKVKI